MRPPNWPALLNAYLDSARDMPFAWGTHDCVTFACGWHALMTGRDAYAPWRGRYKSRVGAARRIKEAGGEDMRGAGKILFGAVSREINRGDIAMAQDAFGIVTGTHGVFLLAGGGIASLARDKFQVAWSV